MPLNLRQFTPAKSRSAYKFDAIEHPGANGPTRINALPNSEDAFDKWDRQNREALVQEGIATQNSAMAAAANNETARTNAEIAQRGLEMKLAEKQARGLDFPEYYDKSGKKITPQDRELSQLGLSDAKYKSEQEKTNDKLKNEKEQLGLDSTKLKNEMDEENYRSMAPLKGQTVALAKIGSILDSVDVDKDGVADATKYKDDLAKVWGFDPEKYQAITLKGDKETGRLQAFGFDGKKSVPITLPSGQTVSVSHEAIYKATQTLMGGGKGKDYEFKTVRGGQDKEGNVLPDLVARMNPQTGDVEFVDQSGQGLRQSAPQISDEEKLSKLGQIMSQANQSQPQKQPGLGGVQANSEPQTFDMDAFMRMPSDQKSAFLNSLTPRQRQEFMRFQQEYFAKRPIKEGLSAVGGSIKNAGNSAIRSAVGLGGSMLNQYSGE